MPIIALTPPSPIVSTNVQRPSKVTSASATDALPSTFHPPEAGSSPVDATSPTRPMHDGDQISPAQSISRIHDGSDG
jgi:hypothetical protein